ncbi:zinc-ribbon domain-containing protein [Paenibacillus odorifer]|uniref:zinc-ribbon domain-containing protein n=1 Tax=Paenibacillus odorifer TaxID=189426 RepID=UPI0015B802B0|nr:zinc-ribbon domain-containing protein [Paenibacillus odorifer]
MERVGSLADNHPGVAQLWHPLLNGELTARDVMGKSVKKVWWLCDEPLCGNSWQAVICDVTKGSRCPACSRSRGERKVRAHLIDRKVPFIAQASVSGLVGVCRGDLLFDFVVTSISGDWLLAVEYDGIQHSKPVDFAGLGEDDALRVFRRTSIHDQRKTAWASLHGVPLLRIPYDDFENVESILDNALAQLEMFREISPEDAA